MVKSVVREYHWAPEVVGALFFDAEDYKGLGFWYNDAKEVSESITK